MRRSKCVSLTLAIMLAFGAAGTGTAAASSPTPTHCVVHVIGEKPSGELLVGPESCFATLEEAMIAEGVAEWGTGASSRASALATFTIGIHYDGGNLTGASMSVVGSNCSGGWLNVSAIWNNRISSTEHGCPRIRHYNGTNLTGSSQTTVAPGGNLTTLNNLTSSIQYLS